MKTIVQLVEEQKEYFLKKDTEAKQAVEANIAPVEADPSSASRAYVVGEQLILNDVLYDVTSPISVEDAIVVGTNITAANKLSADIKSKQDQIEVTTMPTASASNVGKVLIYIGSTTSTYTSGQSYQSTLEGGNYIWKPTSISSVDASDVVYDNQTSGLTATNSQAAIDELASQNQTLTNEVDAIVNVYGSKNILANNINSGTINGITITKNADKTLTVSGTASADVLAVFENHKFSTGNYILSGCPSGGSSSSGYSIVVDTKGYDTGDGFEFSIPSETSLDVKLLILSGTVITTPITFKPMIRDARIADGTYEPYAMTNQQITPYVQAISNPNLLDNPWFTVNQRGKNSYSTTGADYTFDRWYSYEGNTSVVQNADGSITLGAVEGVTKAVYFRQKIENTNKLLGKTLTISLLKDDNTIITATGDVPSAVPSTQTGVALAYIKENNVNIGTVSITFLANSYLSASIAAYAGNSVTFKAVKIELGSVSTLAMDTAPNYQQELAKCQRYFQRFGSNESVPAYRYNLGMAFENSSNAYYNVTLSVPMRSTPSISYQGSWAIGGKALNNITAYSMTNNIVKLVCTTSQTLTTGKIELLENKEAGINYIDLSADL